MSTATGHHPTRYFYGPDPSHYGDLYLPSQPRRPGSLVLIHGGFWGPMYGSDLLDRPAADLAQRGWAVWNIEYRRLERGGGYPTTLEDVAAAIDYLDAVEGVDTDRVVAVGHSAGGHLAAWAASRNTLASGAPGAGPAVEVGGVVSLAGVLDLASAARQKIGNGAAIHLMGGTPDEVPGRYLVADPLAHVPIRAAVHCVHARPDDRVPFAQSVTYVEAARAASQVAALHEVPGDHFSVIEVSSAAWRTVVEAIEALA